MKKKIILTIIVSLFLAATISAQTVTNYTGVWELDVSRSTLPDTMQIETMTLKVRQTEKSLQFESSAKRSQKSDAGTKPKTGFLTQTASFNLESEATNSINGGETATPREKASVMADGRLNLIIVYNFQNEMGNFTIKINEIWELLDGGNLLKITRYAETPRGATNAEMYFTKKSSGALMIEEDSSVPVDTRPSPRNEASVPSEIPANDKAKIPKKISAGVLNGKAISLPKPEYPAAAKAVNASGAVNVQVTIDEQGNLISANAVSGHPLLRQAAEEAARNAKFAPTLLSGVPVKVTGVLVYNFTP